MKRLKIYGEHTRPTDGPPLCYSCRNAVIVRGTRMGDDIIRCGALRQPIRLVVTECSAYDDAALVSVYSLEQTAWRWMGGIDRFVSPAEFQRLARKAVEEDDDD